MASLLWVEASNLSKVISRSKNKKIGTGWRGGAGCLKPFRGSAWLGGHWSRLHSFLNISRRSESGSAEYEPMRLTQQPANVPREIRYTAKRNKWLTKDNQFIIRVYFWSTDWERYKGGYWKRMLVELTPIRPECSLIKVQNAIQF